MLRRLFTPLVFLAAAAWVLHHNQTDGASILVFPFVDMLVPSTRGDPRAMGVASAGLLAVLGALFGVRGLVAAIRAPGDPDD